MYFTEKEKQQAKSGLSRTPSTRSNRSLPDTPDSWNGEHETGVYIDLIIFLTYVYVGHSK